MPYTRSLGSTTPPVSLGSIVHEDVGCQFDIALARRKFFAASTDVSGGAVGFRRPEGLRNEASGLVEAMVSRKRM